MHKLFTKSLAALLLLAAACNSAGSDATGDVAEPVDATVEGDDGLLTFEIESDEPLAEGRNDFTVRVLHDGQPFTASSISATVAMASMTHGSTSAEISDLGAGTYGLRDVELSMPGEWRLSLFAENGETLKIRDTAALVLDVP